MHLYVLVCAELPNLVVHSDNLLINFLPLIRSLLDLVTCGLNVAELLQNAVLMLVVANRTQLILLVQINNQLVLALDDLGIVFFVDLRLLNFLCILHLLEFALLQQFLDVQLQIFDLEELVFVELLLLFDFFAGILGSFFVAAEHGTQVVVLRVQVAVQVGND